MESNSDILEWLCFSGLAEENPIWSTRFQAFAHAKGLFERITGNDLPPNPLGWLGIDPVDAERAALDAAETAYGRAVDDLEKR